MTESRYRSKLRICYDILNTIEEEGGETGPTRILYKANLSHNRLMRYLKELEAKNLVEKKQVDGRTCYRLTRKGRMFLRDFAKIEEFLNSFGFTI